MPKNKTHSGTKKRVRVTGTGSSCASRPTVATSFEDKPSTRTRRLDGRRRACPPADAKKVKKLLGTEHRDRTRTVDTDLARSTQWHA